MPSAHALGFFIFGVCMIGYGLVSPSLVKVFAQRVVEVLGGGDAAVLLICETAVAETGLGIFPDKTRGSAGRGLCQVDPIGFEDVIARARQSDVDAVEREFDIRLRSRVAGDRCATLADLDYSPLLSLIICRLHYKLRQEPLPQNLAGRARYWKKYYNTSAGAGTEKDYIFRVTANAKYL